MSICFSAVIVEKFIQQFFVRFFFFIFIAEDDTSGEATTCGRILIFLSWVLVVLTMPFSLVVCFKVSLFWLYYNYLLGNCGLRFADRFAKTDLSPDKLWFNAMDVVHLYSIAKINFSYLYLRFYKLILWTNFDFHFFHIFHHFHEYFKSSKMVFDTPTIFVLQK